MHKMLLIGLTTLGLGVAAPIVAQAQAGLPAGYTRSQTVIPGQHCYRSGGQVYFYCYPRAIETYRSPSNPSMMAPGGSMMQSSPRPSGTMMTPGGSMMNPGGTMMQPSPSPNR